VACHPLVSRLIGSVIEVRCLPSWPAGRSGEPAVYGPSGQIIVAETTIPTGGPLGDERAVQSSEPPVGQPPPVAFNHFGTANPTTCS
jgi:hypothetical protein